ncbi:TetR/AcrR family transcriptional regulator [Streptomonospora wellingtoniae]|uniref:TetR/AcrR family transcriptional regulator n=1 Tax=Streptomonospora wellingtoniae TaxID=3075544 RepID=A0ABU2KNT9_9ACTN|nr:TetR/AcrR family transcriptional regulator [Streptomonospora sp. DSM 45055]MDT0300803.1 TetR/AcrR family transcriptional regulator [Streptomonospora sp. DSM 45055]
MPAAFSADEKARIKGLLMESGRRLFTTRGLRKTSLEDLVAPAAIAKSSFYQFFDSKEALYLELMTDRMTEVRRATVDDALLSAPGTREGLRRFLHATVDVLTTDPLYSRLMTHPEEMAAVSRRHDPESVTGVPGNPVTALFDFVAEKRGEGALVAADPAVIVGVLQAVLLLPMNADRLASPEHYPQVLDLLVDVVAAGLAPERV